MDFKEEILRSLEVSEEVVVKTSHMLNSSPITALKVRDEPKTMLISVNGSYFSVPYYALTCKSFEVYDKLKGEQDLKNYFDYVELRINAVRDFYLNKDNQQHNNGIIITGQGA